MLHIDPPTSHDRGPRFKLVRPKPGIPVTGIVASEMFGCFVHYHNERTFWCTNDDKCEGCKDGKYARYVGHVFMIPTNESRPFILAMPYFATVDFVKWAETVDSVIGYGIQAERAGKSIRSKMRISATRERLIPIKDVPALPKMEHILSRIWSEIATI